MAVLQRCLYLLSFFIIVAGLSLSCGSKEATQEEKDFRQAVSSRFETAKRDIDELDGLVAGIYQFVAAQQPNGIYFVAPMPMSADGQALNDPAELEKKLTQLSQVESRLKELAGQPAVEPVADCESCSTEQEESLKSSITSLLAAAQSLTQSVTTSQKILSIRDAELSKLKGLPSVSDDMSYERYLEVEGDQSRIYFETLAEWQAMTVDDPLKESLNKLIKAEEKLAQQYQSLSQEGPSMSSAVEMERLDAAFKAEDEEMKAVVGFYNAAVAQVRGIRENISGIADEVGEPQSQKSNAGDEQDQSQSV